MRILHKLIKSRIDIFGTIGIRAGYAVSWQDDYNSPFDGYAVPYTGQNLLGISCQNVIPIDFKKQICPWDCVADGSKIEIVEEGIVVVEPRKNWKSGLPITISKKGRLKLAKEHHKIYGEIQSVNSDNYALVYFRKWGL